jgi:hypothetical protein
VRGGGDSQFDRFGRGNFAVGDGTDDSVHNGVQCRVGGSVRVIEKTNYWIAAAVAGGAKFGFLVLSANVILAAMTHGKMTAALASMMGWPQLITALLGAGLAFAVFERKLFKKM